MDMCVQWSPLLGLLLAAVTMGRAQAVPARAANLPAEAEQVFALGNQARTQAGAPPLRWDPALAAAALAHCRLMVQEGALGHRYQGEPDLAARAGTSGAHFALIEENVAEAPTAAAIHGAWMNSPGHRKNLLNPDVDRVGIAVIARGEELYAVADYARAAPVLDASAVEERVAQLIAVSGVRAAGGSAAARAACATDHGIPPGAESQGSVFVMRWEDADLSRLPEALTTRLASGRYRSAAVGSCPAHGGQPAFTVYRVAVLLRNASGK